MKTQIIFLALIILSLNSCTKGGFMTPELNTNINPIPGTASVENIDVNLLKEGAKIDLYINEKNEVTASFNFPQPNTNQIVSWWYRWDYITTQKDGVKSCYDKTLKYIAQCNSYVLLYIQCTKPDGVKSDIKLTCAKVNLYQTPKQKMAVLK